MKNKRVKNTFFSQGGMVQLTSTATGRVPHKAALTLTLLSTQWIAYRCWPSPQVTEHWTVDRRRHIYVGLFVLCLCACNTRGNERKYEMCDKEMKFANSETI